MIFCIFLLLHFIGFAFAIPCYFHNTALAQNDSSCSASASAASPSSCCPVGYACLSNSVCQDPTVLGGFVRGSCTDKTWESDACPKYCVINQEDGPFRMLRCANGAVDEYCCDGDLSCDCVSGDRTVKFNGRPSVLTVIGVANWQTVSTAPTPSATTITLPAVTVTPVATVTVSAELPFPKNEPTVVGAAVGVPLGVLAIVFFCLYFYERAWDGADEWPIFDKDT